MASPVPGACAPTQTASRRLGASSRLPSHAGSKGARAGEKIHQARCSDGKGEGEALGNSSGSGRNLMAPVKSVLELVPEAGLCCEVRSALQTAKEENFKDLQAAVMEYGLKGMSQPCVHKWK